MSECFWWVAEREASAGKVTVCDEELAGSTSKRFFFFFLGRSSSSSVLERGRLARAARSGPPLWATFVVVFEEEICTYLGRTAVPHDALQTSRHLDCAYSWAPVPGVAPLGYETLSNGRRYLETTRPPAPVSFVLEVRPQTAGPSLQRVLDGCAESSTGPIKNMAMWRSPHL